MYKWVQFDFLFRWDVNLYVFASGAAAVSGAAVVPVKLKHLKNAIVQHFVYDK
jgi:hypothetical protein